MLSSVDLWKYDIVIPNMLESPQNSEEVEALMSHLCDCIKLLRPGNIIRGCTHPGIWVIDSLHHHPVNEGRFIDPQLSLPRSTPWSCDWWEHLLCSDSLWTVISVVVSLSNVMIVLEPLKPAVSYNKIESDPHYFFTWPSYAMFPIFGQIIIIWQKARNEAPSPVELFVGHKSTH